MKSNHPHAGADVRSFDYPSLIANFASDVILVATPDFLCVWASPSVTTALGWKPSELIGRTTTDLIHPDDAANVLARREVAGTDVVQVPRSRLRRRDGSYLWVSARAQTITSDQYAGELRVIILRDVQEEVEVEEELRLRMIDLQNTYKLLQRSQELAGIATFRIDLDREVISLSPELSEMYGAGHEGLELPLTEYRKRFYHPDDLASKVTMAESAYQHGSDLMLDSRVVRPDGRVIWVRSASSVVHQLDGTSYVLGVVQDVSSFMATQERLAESEARFRMIADNASDVIVRLDPQDVVTWVSPSVREVLGWDPSDVIGRSMADFITDDSLLTIAETSRSATTDLRADDELEIRRADGSLLLMGSRSRPVFDTAGELVARVTSLRDTDATVRARRELITSELRYRLLAENVTDIVYQISYDGVIEWISPSVQQLLGFQPEELIGTEGPLLFAEEDRAVVSNLREQLRAGHAVEPTELRYLTAEGDRHWMSAHAHVLHDAEGNVSSAVVGVRDCHAEVVARRAAQTLSAGNAILSRVTSEDDLLGAMCGAAVVQGGYLFAWYGRPVEDAGKSVHPVAASTEHRSYLDEISVSWGDNEFGHGPTGTAIRTGETVIVDDFNVDDSIGPWRPAMISRGFQSSISLPVVVGGRVDGALMVYAGEAHAFNGESAATMEDLAAQLGFGLGRIRDLTKIEQVSADRALLATAIDQATDGVVLVDVDRMIVYANPAALRLSGWTLEEARGKDALSLGGRNGASAVLDDLWAAVAADRKWTGVVDLSSGGGNLVVEINSAPVYDDRGARIAYVLVMHDLTVEHRLEADLLQAQEDQGAIVELMGRARPTDTLEETVRAFTDAVRKLEGIDECFILLVGPDGELVPIRNPEIFLPWLDTASLPGLDALRDRLGADPSQALIVDLTTSVAGGPVSGAEVALALGLVAAGFTALGCALIRTDGQTIGVVVVGTRGAGGCERLESRRGILAEFGSYAGTLLGTEAERKHQRERLRLRIVQIIENRRFYPVFQPVLDLETREIRGYEALTRFDDGTRPDLQMLEAHSCGLGIELETACVVAALHAARDLAKEIWLSINFSPSAIIARGAAAMVRDSGREIVVEVTEHAPVDSYPAIREALVSYGAVGVAVDDAGAGYASLRHILELKPDIIKLDIGLVRDIDRDPARQAMAAGLAHFGEQVGATLLAEGIETLGEAQTVKSLGVSLGQGFLFGRPAPLA